MWWCGWNGVGGMGGEQWEGRGRTPLAFIALQELGLIVNLDLKHPLAHVRSQSKEPTATLAELGR